MVLVEQDSKRPWPGLVILFGQEFLQGVGAVANAQYADHFVGFVVDRAAEVQHRSASYWGNQDG